jgi:hypothetical protein
MNALPVGIAVTGVNATTNCKTSEHQHRNAKGGCNRAKEKQAGLTRHGAASELATAPVVVLGSQCEDEVQLRTSAMAWDTRGRNVEGATLNCKWWSS